MAGKKISDLTAVTSFDGTEIIPIVQNGVTKKVTKSTITETNYTQVEKTKLAGLVNYTLPVATSSSLGGVKAGTNITIDANGVISSTASGGSGSSSSGSLSTDNTLVNANSNDPVNSPTNPLGVNTAIIATKAYVDSKAGFSVERQNSNTGATYTITNSTANRITLAVNPSTILATKVITLPATPVAEQEVIIEFGGTISSGVVITNLTLSANQNILQRSSPNGQIVAGDSIRYIYNTVTGWYRHN